MAEKCQKIEPQRHGKNEEKEKRRSRSGLRPNAALKEKERLKAFNEALRNLQQVIPIKLPEGRKLHKKQTLQVIILVSTTLFTELPWPGDSERTFQSSSQATTCPPHCLPQTVEASHSSYS